MTKHERRLKDLRITQIGIIDRQWTWANTMKILYEDSLKKTPKEILFNPTKFYINPVGCYHNLWYSLLFTVLETLRDWSIEIDTVQDDINEVYPLLKQLRHATFHRPKKYIDKRFYNLLTIKHVGNKLRNIHGVIGSLLLEIMKSSIKNEKESKNKS